jgi:hypothetical protein
MKSTSVPNRHGLPGERTGTRDVNGGLAAVGSVAESLSEEVATGSTPVAGAGTGRTPIQAWPLPVYRGRPGYSARHFAALNAGNENSPLQVAERIARRADGERILAEAQAKRAAGEDFDAVLDWQSRQLSEASQVTWRRLCESFDFVIATLQSVPQTTPMRALVGLAKREQRRAS